MPVIYIDVLLILNLWADFLLLSLTARICHVPTRRWRLVCGAGVGALLCLLLFLPPLHWSISILVRLIGTVVLVGITFGFVGWRTFAKRFLTLTVLSAGFAGLATAFWYMAAPAGFMVINGVVYYDAPASVLIVFTVISYLLILLYERLRRRRAPHNRLYSLTVRENGKALTCRLLYDSGCTLREPFSGTPTLIIDRVAVMNILPKNWLEETETARHRKVRFVPFKTVGGEGVLPAFCPQVMEITDKKGNRWDISGAFLAVSDDLGHGEYTALCGTDIGDILEGR